MPEAAVNLYRSIPYVNKPVSRILCGTAAPPLDNGGDGEELLDAILALGINCFDLARVYGTAEAAIGQWMAKRGNREQVVLLSKCAHPTPNGQKRVSEKAIRQDFQESSADLQTDYIDIYLLHRDDTSVDVAVAVETLNALHAEGKIGAFGGSNWTHQRIEEANEYAYKNNLIPFTVSSPNFGLAEQIADIWGDGITISGGANEDARAWYTQTQMPVIAHSSLGRGFFSGKLKSTDAEKADRVLDSIAIKGFGSKENYARLARCEKLAAEKNCSVPQIAMAWLLGQSVNTFAVVSTSSPARMGQNIEALRLQLSQQEMDWLDLKAERCRVLQT